MSRRLARTGPAVGRKRRGIPIHGWLAIDKPAGLTSAAGVGKVRALTGAAKVGHGGTLDPLATGVLPIALGEATKTVSYVMDCAKTYEFTVRWGEARATDDAEGAVVARSDVRPSGEAIANALPGLTGLVQQTPPVYSAIKVDGARAYALARSDAAPELAPREVRVDRFVLLGQLDADHARFEVQSGKGCYMRALARDLALAVGTVGYILDLRRTAVGRFTQETAISLEQLASVGHSAPLSELLLPVETALDDIPALALTDMEARHLRQGRSIPVLPVATRSPPGILDQDHMVCAMAEGKPVALARVVGGELRPVRVLNL